VRTWVRTRGSVWGAGLESHELPFCSMEHQGITTRVVRGQRGQCPGLVYKGMRVSIGDLDRILLVGSRGT
jgi:hypothetical protein